MIQKKKENVDLFAMGVTYGYNASNVRGTVEGTSISAPRVAGAAAVLLNINPNLTAAEIKHYIMSGVDYSSNLASLCVSGGSLNVYKSAKMLISDMACDNQTMFVGHFTDADKLQVACYVKTATSQIKCYVWTFDAETKTFSDPEHWFTNNNFVLNESENVNMYRSVAGDFDGDGFYEICTLYNESDCLYIAGKGYTVKPVYINQSVENFTGRVTVGDYDNDGKDEVAALYKVPGVWAHTKLYVWDFSGSKSSMSGTEKIVYDSGAGNYAADYITDKIVSGDFDGDGSDEVGGIYYFSSSGKYSLHSFDINIGSSAATLTNLIYGQTNVDASKIDGRVVACNYNGGGDDEIVCLYDNSVAVSGGIINYGFRFTSYSNSWVATPLYTSGANEYIAARSKYLMVAGDFAGANYNSPDALDDIVTFYKVPAADENNIRGKLYISIAPGLAGYTTVWDPKS